MGVSEEWGRRGQAGVGSRKGAVGEEEEWVGRRAGSWTGGGGSNSSEEEACWESEAGARSGGQAEEVARRWWSCRWVEGAWPRSRGEDREGLRAEGGSPLDGGRQVCHRVMVVEVVVAPPGGPSSPAVDGLEVAPVVEGVSSGSALCLVDTPPSVVVSRIGPETVVTVAEVGLPPSVGLSENCSGSPSGPPAPVFEVVVVAVVVDLLPVPTVVAFGSLAVVLPLAVLTVAVVVVVVMVVISSDWLRPRLDVERGTGLVGLVVDSVLVHVASG